MHRASSVTPLDGYRLAISFEDGLQGTVSMRERLFGPVFEPLRDEAVFQRVSIDEFGVICWPNGADLAPDALYERIWSSAEVETVL
jgi:hypothetical protein